MKADRDTITTSTGVPRKPGARGDGDPIVRVNCIRHVYPDHTQVDLCGLDFTVSRGERVAVLGANGSGKSTLIYHLLGLLAPVEGQVAVFGENPAQAFRRIRHRVGVVLQNVDDQIIGPTVWDDVTFTIRNLNWPRADIEAAGNRILGRLGIAHLAKKIPHYLSGGEKRKVALAGALASRPELLIMDEPFTGLDPKAREELVDLLNQVHVEDGLSYIVSTHEVDFVPAIADYVYVLGSHGIVMSGTPRQVFAQAPALRASHIGLPAITELFERLQRAGWDVGTPLTAAEAEAELSPYRSSGS
ncbi:MAG: energy-coupling factor ABC transporter ATP-binding protein [Firmicutes bacterium]|jgi:cobalt/nickel transport system ATP-binding protein|nr:energy-coupling factor ABC transporter ATP-binding protein [Bacillota bacterium]